MVDKHVAYIAQAADAGAQIVCLQEIFYGPYFCAEQTHPLVRLHRARPRRPHHPPDAGPRADSTTWRSSSPSTRASRTGVYYNTAAVIDADGTYLGKYRKTHIPHVAPASGRSSTSGPATSATPSSTSASPRSASTSATTATSPKARARLGLNGAEIVFNPSATVAGLSEYLWKLEQPAHAVANGYFIGAINRVGIEAPWNIGEFYGSELLLRSARPASSPQASRDRDEVLTADLDLDMIAEVRKTWQFFRDRRPDMYRIPGKGLTP